MEVVELSWHLLRQAALAGVERHIESLQSNRSGRVTTTNWNIDVMGAESEAAFAKWLGVYWDSSPNLFRMQPDVAGFDVKSKDVQWGDLIIRPNDSVDRTYVLVLCHDRPRYTIAGWAHGSEIKQDRFYKKLDKSRPECWVYPQRLLHSMDTLPDLYLEYVPRLISKSVKWE